MQNQNQIHFQNGLSDRPRLITGPWRLIATNNEHKTVYSLYSGMCIMNLDHKLVSFDSLFIANIPLHAKKASMQQYKVTIMSY